MVRASNIIVVDTMNRILLQQRDAKEGIANPGGWAMWGGAAEEGETFEVCAVRELREEIGADVRTKDLVLLSQFVRPSQTHGEVESAIFLFRLPKGFRVLLGEGEGYGFFKKEEIPHLHIALGHPLKKFLFDFLDTF